MTRAVTPGKITFVTRKELSEVVAEAAARTERAAARIETTRAEMEVWRAQNEKAMEVWRAENEKAIEAARAKQEEARASQEAVRTELEKLRPIWEEERVESKRKTDQILAELKEGRDERRAMLEALSRVIDRLPPPPPNLRSA